ncbi:hypothetical protein [Chryseolinea sp. H1M3-3]|uniref:hypothetical protein n=1 Tax=Chryseolinea sp. H1M3-3 TaxID=3034144 RepID=UPI0023EBAD5C|nr:hypothetical protein [Chryseolinea sp. H1M3-3]
MRTIKIPDKKDYKFFDEYCRCHEIKESQYTTGLFQAGITVYKQQIRALNLFYAMHKTDKFESTTSICIIGGGVAGLTFAAAALMANVKVYLLEKESTFLHLQQGCDTRKIYPYLYNWPDKGSRFPYAKLPILPWKADSAANVAKEILERFYEVEKSVETDLCEAFVDVDVKYSTRPIIAQQRGQKKFDLSFYGTRLKFGVDKLKTQSRIIVVDHIIYCTGFGIERSHLAGITPSYWRNDDYGQTVINNKTNFFISGVGDGALIDLFRLKIQGFSYDFFLDRYYSANNESEVTTELLKIKEEFESNPSLTPVDLYRRFDSMHELLVPLMSFLKDHKRNNINVKLVAKRRFNEILDLNQISFINALILFLLLIENKGTDGHWIWFDYIVGKTSINGNHCKLQQIDPETLSPRGKPTAIKDAIPIIRHGSQRESAFGETNLTKDPGIDALKERQEESNIFNYEGPIWTFESITALFKQPPKRFLCTNETITLCTPLVSILSKMIRACSGNKKGHFKVGLFRVVNSGGQRYFQSIAPYFGSKNPKKGKFGKLIQLNKGPLGMAAFLREPVLLVRKTGFEKILEYLNLKPTEIFANSQSVLVIPILAKWKDYSPANLLVCVDSDSATLLNDYNVILAIKSIMEGWINSINRAVGKQILMDDITFNPRIDVSGAQVENYVKVKKSKCFVKTLLDDHRDLKPKYSKLCFNDFYSFDVYYKTSPEEETSLGYETTNIKPL